MSGELPGLPGGCMEIDTFLRNEGFCCEEEDSTDSSRWRWYQKEFRQYDSNAMLRLVIRFELTITDGGGYNENHNLYFNDIYLEIYDRQMEQDDSYSEYGRPEYDNETEQLLKIDMYELRIRSYAELKQFEQCIN